MAAKARLTEAAQEKFLELLAENGGVVCDAASALNISRTALYALRNSDSEFKRGWDEAQDRGVDLIEDEARRRALVGTDHPVTFQGKITDTYKEKSDYCLGLILKAHRAKFRDRHELSGPDGGPLLPPKVVVYIPDNARDRKEHE